ncbi:pantetheine-phosphate adenylyltransferase [Aceticella autotrophica]|jgi:pantetheine-phosphate adenylyltransferase|uniref:Phosphopantetheine adenylyltransferase n=1 Tax=Aceticella autotrophica TaxID=2755338 RepID=A0A975AUF7_9THEO|nr:pantetheine-phosphate adenylyltransferase [Aceticella autotrophica]MDI6604668.1 pantetheine-phosphate adenylyltransferase [Thermoanaerobacteraceae bacterium]QSZ26657.1 pantetheine-phosphate adenylyltransferase [Aceticella autotrophica]
MKIAVYPGSFDPVTNGHLDIIKRASKVFDELIVAVLINPSKNAMFSVDERVELLKIVTSDIENVKIDCFTGLLIDYLDKVNSKIIVKGLRMISDFEYEFQMALINKKLNPDIETLFFMTSNKYGYLSSSIVKEVAKFGGCLSDLVPDIVIKRIFEKLK